MKLKKYRFIFILVILMMGLSITGWSISTHFDHTLINSELQKEMKNDSQIDNTVLTVLREFSNNVPVLSLISTGLIGLLGIRRQTKKIDNSSLSR
jgi:hypothetical protein